MRIGRPSGLAMVSMVILGCLWAPIAIVAINSVNSDERLISWGGFTTQWFSEALDDQRVRDAFVTSLEVALLSTIVSLAIAITASLWVRRASARARRALDATTYMRIILPETVLAIGLFLLLRRYDVGLGVATIVIGHVVFNSAYATIVIQARMSTLSETLEQAAADLGATPWRVFRRVTLPLIMPAVIVAGLLVFSFSLRRRGHVAVPGRAERRDAAGAAARPDPPARDAGGERDRRARDADHDRPARARGGAVQRARRCRARDSAPRRRRSERAA